MKRKLAVITAVLLIGTTTISLVIIGGKNYMDRYHEETELNKKKINIESQRKAALVVKSEEPNATKLVFTNEGYSPGFGVSWTFTPQMTIGGETLSVSVDGNGLYSVYYGTDYDDSKRTKYRAAQQEKNSKTPLEVIYSNNEREVLQ